MITDGSTGKFAACFDFSGGLVITNDVSVCSENNESSPVVNHN